MKKWEILEHPADVGFVAYGGTREELFESAADAMLALACEPEGIVERERRDVEATGGDMETLLYAWLAEILATAEVEQMVARRVEVTELGEGRARGVLHGEKFDKVRHRLGTYIKAVTLHQFEITQSGQGWRARVYLDV